MSENQATSIDPTNQPAESDKNQDLTDPSFDMSDSLLRLVVGGFAGMGAGIGRSGQ